MSTRSAQRLLPEARRRLILETIEEKETVRVEDLVGKFGVSSVTIRGDLQALNAAGLVLRAHGGAMKKPPVPKTGNSSGSSNVLFSEDKEASNAVRIAYKAVDTINDGETIILDSGEIPLQIAQIIREKKFQNLTVISNAINVASALAKGVGVRTILLGGILRPSSESLVGPQSEKNLREMNADRAFIEVKALDPKFGLSSPDVLEAQLTAEMIRAADHVTLVMDSSYFGKRSLSVIAQVGDCHTIVTDSGISSRTRKALIKAGVEIEVV